MKTIDYRFNLDLHAEGAQTIKNVQRGDNYVKLIVTFSEEGKPYPLSGIATAKFAALKADGNYIYDNTQIVNNSVEFVLTGQCTAAAGLMVCQFKMLDGSGHIKASPTFALNICENAYDEQPIVESSDEFNALTLMIADLEQKLASGYFDGEDGQDGVSATHSWNGTVLTITSASGTSSADLKGAKGDPGETPDISGKVDKSQKVAGIELSSDISKDDLVDNIHSKINPTNVVSGQTNGYLGQYGSTADKKPMFYIGMSNWAELAKASDIPDVSGKADAATTIAGYGITDAYTKTQVDNLISAVSTLSFEVVQALPTTDIKTNVIYLLPKQTPTTGNIYEEWAYINNNWELLGTTDIDISGKEDKSNKVTSIDSSSTNTQYPSAKLLFDTAKAKPTVHRESFSPPCIIKNSSAFNIGDIWVKGDQYVSVLYLKTYMSAYDLYRCYWWHISPRTISLSSLPEGGRLPTKDYTASGYGERAYPDILDGDIIIVNNSWYKCYVVTRNLGDYTYSFLRMPSDGDTYTKAEVDTALSGKVNKQTSLPQVATIEQQGQYVVDTTDSSFQNLAITQMFTAEISEVVYTYQKTGVNTYITLTGLAHTSDIDDAIGNIETALSEV